MSRRTITAVLAGTLFAASLVGAPATAATTWSSPPWDVSADLTGAIAGVADIALSDDGTRATAVWTLIPPPGTKYVVQTASATISDTTADWSAPQTLSSDTQNAGTPRVALSADGTKAVALWTVDNEGSWTVQAASAAISGTDATWASAQNISTVAQQFGQPQIALSDSGTMATAIWFRSDGGTVVIQSASATIGATTEWSAPTDLSSSNSEWPQIALSADGTMATAVWHLNNGSGIQSRSATISGKTATWSSAIVLASGGIGSLYEPQIALSADGTRATAVWSFDDGTNIVTQSKSSTILGNTAIWSPDQALSPSPESPLPPGYANRQQVSVSADGTKATALWQFSNDGTTIVQTASATIDGSTATWSSVQNMSTANGYEPRVALSDDGMNAVAVWYLFNGTAFLIQSADAAISSGGVAIWSSAQDLSAAGTYSFSPDVAISADGTKATAVWLRTFPSSRVQSASAKITGGAEPHALGYWKRAALTELLPQPLGAYEVGTQTQARAVLKATNCGARPSAVAGCLAGQLLVGELNVEAGVDDSCIEADITDANEFLDDVVDYDGPGTYSLSKTQRREALTLITRLVAFNSEGCP